MAAIHEFPYRDDERATVRVPIDRVHPGAPLRLGAMRTDHLDLLVQLGGAWAPVLVTRTGRIVDGHYRYVAAQRLGLRHLECEVFLGNEDEAFLEAVRRNSTHGLPLTLEERRNAAARVLAAHPHWSDRRIGVACGLAHETVGRLRLRLSRSGEIRHLERRQGRDGKYQRTARPRATADADAPSTADDAFVSTESGRTFLDWFSNNTIADDWAAHVAAVPLSRVYEIADEARRRAAAWSEFATALGTRASSRAAGRRAS
jgi:hypothetical protein